MTLKLSVQAGSTVNGQVSAAGHGGLTDQGRVILDTGHDLYNWLEMSLTKEAELDVHGKRRL